MPTTAATSTPPARWTPTRYCADVPQTGERFELVSSARSGTDGKFRFVWTLAPGKRGPGEHYHADDTEVFEIVAGTLRIWQDGVPCDHGPGEVVVLAPGVRHRFLNPGTEPAVVNVTLDGTRMEDVLAPIAVATHGRKPRLEEIARMLVSAVHYMPSVPAHRWERGLMRALAGTLSLFGAKAFEPVHGWDRTD